MPPTVTTSRRKPSAKNRPVLILIAVCAIGAACYLVCSKATKPGKGNGQPDAVAAPRAAETNRAANVPDAGEAVEKTAAEQEVADKPGETEAPVDPADDPINPLSGLPQSKHEIWYREEMERNTRVAEIIEARNPRVHFDNAVENELEAVWSDDVVEIDEVPRIDGFTEEQIIAYLKKPVVYNEDDDEFTVASKRKAEHAKKDALGYIEKGFTINDYLRDAAASRNEANEMRRDVREEMERILDNEGEEAAIAYLNEVNPQLEKEGVKPVQKPGRIARIKSRKRLERQQREAEEAASGNR